jgi:hypothetical protein
LPLQQVGQLGDVGGDAARPVSITSTSATVAACGQVAHEAVKIFMLANREKPVIVPYMEHVPPDVTADIFWLKTATLSTGAT